LNLLGVGLALYTFMATALGIVGGGGAAIRNALPTSFNWPLFAVALALLAVPIADVGWQVWRRRRDGRVEKPVRV
jgi:hypothetical protein